MSGSIGLIESAFEKATRFAVEDLNASNIDVVFRASSSGVIPEIGVGGLADGSSYITVCLDPGSGKIDEMSLLASLLHEFHHCMRFRELGHEGGNPGEALICEGAACLYEEQRTGRKPVYADVALDEDSVKVAMSKLHETEYDYCKWFFGTGSMVRWFGYALGYRLCKAYSEQTGRTASEMVNVPADKVLKVSSA